MAYLNSDLEVTPLTERYWNARHFAALWISMSLCIPTYMLASSLIEGGMSSSQALLTVLIGNVVVLFPMLLNGDAGADYGISFPVLVRSSFGIRGANIPALLRAFVACGWFGIQVWIGGQSLYQVAVIVWPSLEPLPALFPAWTGLETGPGLGYFFFLSINMWVVSRGMRGIRNLLVTKAIVLPLLAGALLMWAFQSTGQGLSLFHHPSRFKTNHDFFEFFFPSLTAMVGFWATLSLNIPDFTRYAVSKGAHRLGQSLALPLSMTLFSMVGILVTNATVLLYGQPIWDPILLTRKFTSPGLVVISLLAIAISTLATNIAANIVSPANDFSNLAPQWINFKRGGYLTGMVGTLLFPWKLIATPGGYIFTWLVGYSSLLGSVGGVMIADYFIVRKKHLDVPALYQKNSIYWYSRGFHLRALVAMILGIAPNLPGFLLTVGVLSTFPLGGFFLFLYHQAWFVSFGISFACYLIFFKPRRSHENPAPTL